MTGKLNFNYEDYLNQFIKLLPQGPAWELENNKFVKSFLEIAALEFARIDADLAVLIKESDPRYASITLSDYFNQWGIPDDCLKKLENATIEQYRQVLITKISTLGYTFDELVRLLAIAFGYESSNIQGFKPFLVISRVDNRLYNYKWRNWFMTVSIKGQNYGKFKTTSRVNEKLATWGNELFECIVKSLAPCHCDIIFRYEK